MSPTPRRTKRPPADPFPDRGLAEIGLAAGDQVRFRRSDAERWKPATVSRRERDGSVGLHDAKGASRAIPIGCIEVRDTGPRGGVVWEPLAARAERTEQLPLVSGPKPPVDRRDTGEGPAPEHPAPDAAGRRSRPAPSAAPAPPNDPDDGQLTLL